ncbi:MAG: quinone-dependent dihydroorotate dehydrogenase [Cyclobacteriaceae bacterium]|nr:quinone-dependent dihydroorotate dehydrogenase [Cyclobacteriaceae bacterium]
MYKALIRPLLFLFSPESVHHFATAILQLSCKIPGIKALLRATFDKSSPELERELFGIKFKNPVGLAAGFDKDARLVDELECLGFGFVEIGTLTPEPQPGNPKPRLFRLMNDQAIINRMGFNNEGVESAVRRLKKRKSSILVGGNIGKNKITDNKEAYLDYEKCFEALFPVVDYFVVNISSPNTPGLRDLQEKEPLKALLMHLKSLAATKEKHKPILLKIAPDLSLSQLDDIVEIVLETKLDGIIATNTTISRADLNTSNEIVDRIGAGGLSGKPLGERSTEVIRYLAVKLNGKVPIIGVGGIAEPKDALDKIRAGASLVQIYTGFIYEGPALIKKINAAILKELNNIN